MPCKITLATILAASAALPLHARAANVACGASGQTITAAINALKPAIGFQTINVSGACKENVFIPQGLALNLLAAPGTSLTSANANYAPIVVQGGQLSVTGLTIKSTDFTGIFVYQGGFATVIATTITGPGSGIQVSNNAGVVVQNSTIHATGAGSNAISTYTGASVEVDGAPAIGKATGTSLTGPGAGIYCGQATLTLNAYGGPIVIADGGSGINMQGCVMQTLVSNGEKITITKNKGAGLHAAQASSVSIQGTEITDNSGNGIYAEADSGVQISGAVTITGNGYSQINSTSGSSIVFRNYAGGVNTVSAGAGNTAPLFGCYQGGMIDTDEIAGVITPAPTSANIGCLTVGSP